MRGIKQNSERVRGLTAKGAAWIWVAMAFLVDMWYQIVPGKWITDGDLAGELLLADLLNKEKGILSRNWFYTTELRVFETQWFYRLGLLLFPSNWHSARVFAAALMTIVLVCAFIYFSKAIDLGNYGIWAAGFLIWPFGFWHLFLTIYGLYYMVYLIFSLLTMGLIIRYVREKKLHRLVLVLILALFSGLNGIRQTIVLFAPLIISAIIIFFVKNKSDVVAESEKKEDLRKRLLIISFLAVIANLLGYAINALVFARKYQFRNFSDFLWGHNAIGPVDTVIDFLKLFGYLEGVPVLSVEGIASLAGVIIACVLVGFTCLLLKQNNEYSFGEQVVIILFSVMVLFQTIVFAFLGNYTINYWLPVLCFAVAALALGFKKIPIPSCIVKQVALIMFSVLIVISSIGAIKKEVTSPLRGKPGLMEVSQWLSENGYNVVIASFWNADQITEFTNGEVEVYIASANAENGQQWLQKTSHFELPKGDYIQLINTNDGENIENYASYPNSSLVYSFSGIEAYYVE